MAEHNNELPETRETEEEKKLSIRDLKNTNFTWALNNLRGKLVKNKFINKKISISRDGLSEWKTKTKSREQAISIKILDQLLKNAVFWKSKPHEPPDPNIKEVIYLQLECKINEKQYSVVITIKKYKAQNLLKYYHHYLEDITQNSKK